MGDALHGRTVMRPYDLELLEALFVEATLHGRKPALLEMLFVEATLQGRGVPRPYETLISLQIP